MRMNLKNSLNHFAFFPRFFLDLLCFFLPDFGHEKSKVLDSLDPLEVASLCPLVSLWGLHWCFPADSFDGRGTLSPFEFVGTFKFWVRNDMKSR